MVVVVLIVAAAAVDVAEEIKEAWAGGQQNAEVVQRLRRGGNSGDLDETLRVPSVYISYRTEKEIAAVVAVAVVAAVAVVG